MFITILSLALPFISIQDNINSQSSKEVLTSSLTGSYLQNIYEGSQSKIELSDKEATELIISFLNNLSALQGSSADDYYEQALNFSKNLKIKEFEKKHLYGLLDYIVDQNKKLTRYPDNFLWIKKLLNFHRDLISLFTLEDPEKILIYFDKNLDPEVSIYAFLNENAFNKIFKTDFSFKIDPRQLVKDGSVELITHVYDSSKSLVKKDILSNLVLTYDFSEKSRNCFKSFIKGASLNALESLTESFARKGKANINEIIFAHVDLNTKNSLLKNLKVSNVSYTKPLPGRLGAEEVYAVKLGDAEMYFFMDLEKYDLSRKMANQADKNLMCSMAVAEFPLPTVEVAATATMFRKPLGFDKKLNPIDIDPFGTHLIDTYTKDVASNIERRFNCNISTLTREMNLVVSHDAMRFHKDQLPLQYAYLNKAGPNFPKCFLAQDLTLMDWGMPVNSFSGTLMRDGDEGDIFFILQFPNEVTSNFTLDPPIYPEDGSPPVYLGPTTLPYHSPYAPVDYLGKYTSGSSNGKRISSVVRGIILDEELNKLREDAIQLSLNKPIKVNKDSLNEKIVYENGVEIQEISKDSLELLSINNLVKEPTDQHVQLLTIKDSLSDEKIKALELISGLNSNDYEVSFKKVIKRTSGFTLLNDLNLELSEGDLCLLINRSKVPDFYEHTHISENCTPRGAPWFHMYFLPPSKIMKLPGAVASHFCLTPIEEMFYRNPQHDAESQDVELLKNRFSFRNRFIYLKEEIKIGFFIG